MRSSPAAFPVPSPSRWAGLALAPDPRSGRAMAALAPFFHETAWTSATGDAEAWLTGEDAPACPGPLRTLRATPGPWPWARFGERTGRAALLAAERRHPGGILPLCLEEAGEAAIDAAAFLDAMRDARVAGPAGRPDPGPAGLGVPAGQAVLVLDPCRPAHAGAIRAMWDSACATAAGRPVVAVRAGLGEATLPAAAGPFAAWTLIEAAAEWHLLEDDGVAIIAAAAGVTIRAHAPLPGFSEGAELARLIGATRFADPFRAAPCTAWEALDIMAAWQRAAAENRTIAVACGMAFWKRARIGAALASETGPPAFRRDARGAVAEARRRGGAIAVWATREPRGLRAAAASAGVPVLRVEDGFLRSAGLGAGFLPGGSIALDAHGVVYDPATASALERILQHQAFPPAMLDRAARLRAALVRRGVTKYNLPGAAPPPAIAPGQRAVLVPGQVEDDASVRLGALDGPRRNLDLLRAARAAEPDAFILYRPHPDVAAGYRAGHVSPDAALAFADAVQEEAAMPALLDWADAVHTMTSLTGFEALLRGKHVVCHGMPFYAGWGLTEDRQALPRRSRRLTLDALVAGALIAYPRCVDPVTELPCPPEVLVDRLGQPQLWKTGRAAALRRWQGRLMGGLARRGWLR